MLFMDKRKSFLIVIIAILTLNFGCSSELTEAEYIERAKDYYDAGRYPESLVELKNALSINLENIEARWLLGKLYLNTGNGAGAEKELAKALELGLRDNKARLQLVRSYLAQQKYQKTVKYLSEHQYERDLLAETHALRGLAYLGMGDYALAENQFKQTRKIEESQLDAGLGLAQLRLIYQEMDKARELVSEVLGHHPNSALGWAMLGDIEQAANKLKAAEAAFSKALDYGSGNANYYYKRALLRIRLGKFDSAYQDIVELNQVAKNSQEALYVQGVYHFKKTELDKAQEYFERVLAVGDEHLGALYYLAVCYYLDGQIERSRWLLTKFISAQPRSAAARLMLARINLKNMEFEEVVDLLEPMRALYPDDGAIANTLASAYIRLGETTEALRILTDLVRSNPNDSAIRSNLATAYLAKGEVVGAIPELEKLSELAPDNLIADLTLVILHIEQNNYVAAESVAQKLAGKEPENVLVKNIFGVIKLAAGEVEQAIIEFEKIIESNPNDPMAYYYLAGVEISRGNSVSAAAYYKKVIDHKSDHYHAHIKLAEIETRNGDFGKAREWLNELVIKRPELLRPRVYLARYYQSQKEYLQARNILVGVKNRYPNNPELELELAKIYMNQRDFIQAQLILKKLVEFHPRSSVIYELLIQSLLASDDREGASRMFDRITTQGVSSFTLRVIHVRLLVHLNEVKKAETIVNGLLKNFPNNREVYALQGWLRLMTNNPQEAAIFYNQAFEGGPKTSKFIQDYALAQWEAKKWQMSLDTLEGWLSKTPDDVAVGNMLGGYYLMMKKREDSGRVLRKVIDFDPENVVALNNLAWIMADVDYDLAVNYAERAYALSNKNPDVLDTYGLLLLKANKNVKALRMLERAAEKRPENPSIQYHLAMALSANGEKDRAKGVLNSLLEKNGYFAEFREAKALVDQLENNKARPRSTTRLEKTGM